MPALNLDLNYFDHRKTVRLAGLLGRGSEVLPLVLWCYCGRHHAEDGRLTGYSPQEVETIVRWRGKGGDAVDALVRVGFLDPIPPEGGGGYQVHDWLDHARHFSMYQQRAKRAADARWDKECYKHATSNAKSDAKQSQCSAMQRNAKEPPNPQGGIDSIPIPRSWKGRRLNALGRNGSATAGKSERS
jgi:hypothetical protein